MREEIKHKISMGLLVDGVWVDQWYKTEDGEFKRKAVQFRDSISEQGPYVAEAGRYHLYVSLACPWAHRTLIFRKLKNLEHIIGVTYVKVACCVCWRRN